MAVPINVCAANQKIKVNPVYQNSKVIKGKTKKRYRVQAKIGKKKYQTKADRKGNFRSCALYGEPGGTPYLYRCGRTDNRNPCR